MISKTTGRWEGDGMSSYCGIYGNYAASFLTGAKYLDLGIYLYIYIGDGMGSLDVGSCDISQLHYAYGVLLSDSIQRYFDYRFPLSPALLHSCHSACIMMGESTTDVCIMWTMVY